MLLLNEKYDFKEIKIKLTCQQEFVSNPLKKIIASIAKNKAQSTDIGHINVFHFDGC